MANFGNLLKQHRKTKRFSQLSLSVEADISQRHISFLESGRANASANMVHKLAKALTLDFPSINRLLLAAGLAPHYKQAADQQEHKYIWQAVDFMLESQMPYPTILLDAKWNIVKSNLAAQKLLVWLMDLTPDEITIMQNTPNNILELILCNPRLRPHIKNWAEIAAHMSNRALNDGICNQAELTAMTANLSTANKKSLTKAKTQITEQAIIPIIYQKDHITLNLISMQTRFMMSQNIALSELSIESFIANDAPTKQFFENF
ncbi:MAG: helix-turn-helix domain-containing protein [Alphaproteobacteria bacterium]|nr:helix-turn-helix domain-containing protein [Alphaproteobacteria bacterium]